MTGERSDPGHDLHSPEWNGHRTKDTMKLLDADGKTVNSVLTYEYDPMDRLVKYTKTGDNATNESYKLDANHNIIEQRINGTTTTYNYDRNRLFSATTSGVTVKYNYDPFGRLDTVTAAGMRIEKYKYEISSPTGSRSITSWKMVRQRPKPSTPTIH